MHSRANFRKKRSPRNPNPSSHIGASELSPGVWRIGFTEPNNKNQTQVEDLQPPSLSLFHCLCPLALSGADWKSARDGKKRKRMTYHRCTQRSLLLALRGEKHNMRPLSLPQAASMVISPPPLMRFDGNVNSETVVQNKLSHPVKTRFLRFVPLDWNPSGWMGLRVEVFGCSYKSYVADFDGRSSLLYRFNQKSMSTVKDVISLRFKSYQAEGVLLHDDSRSRFSSRRVPVTVGSLLDDQHWHSAHIERFNRQVNLTVDSHTQHFQTSGEGLSLEVDYELSFGGIPLPGKPGTFLRKNFHGCIENLYYNGINIIDLAKRRKLQIHSVGNVTFSCSPPQLVACTLLSSSSSFLSLPSAAPPTGEFTVRFQFRTWNPDGLLLSVQLNPSPQKLELQISNSWLHLTLHSTGRQRSEVSAV
ncbi:hypothetical protein CRENBAI_003191 [Crenichthys baileyi]|uniref:Contactin-associated protein-like 5 n=1 Tax=Crenichthys baileyi TaxID=28760 RepID=A0AAV9RNV4_9TELE